MTQDQQRRAANLYVIGRGDLSKKQCEQLAKEWSVKDDLIDRVLGVCLAVVVSITLAVLLGNWAACEQTDAKCLITGSEA